MENKRKKNRTIMNLFFFFSGSVFDYYLFNNFGVNKELIYEKVNMKL